MAGSTLKLLQPLFERNAAYKNETLGQKMRHKPLFLFVISKRLAERDTENVNNSMMGRVDYILKQ